MSGSGQRDDDAAPEHLDAVLAGGWRLRQRPGARNALGDMKFVFPNRENIYLHHTPAMQLFERDRRDFSHGCIRVESPVALARFVLGDDPPGREEAIRQAMAQGESATVRLAQPLPVLIAYGTGLVKAGRVFFFPDLYRHDRLLDAALRQRTSNIEPLPLSLTGSQSALFARVHHVHVIAHPPRPPLLPAPLRPAGNARRRRSAGRRRPRPLRPPRSTSRAAWRWTTRTPTNASPLCTPSASNTCPTHSRS